MSDFETAYLLAVCFGVAIALVAAAGAYFMSLGDEAQARAEAEKKKNEPC